MKRHAFLLTALIAATPALAQDEPRFCPTRPSLGGSSCTTEVGHYQAEMSLIDWQRDDRAGSREDRILAADLLTRVGVGSKTELQLGWTAFGHDRTRMTPGGVENDNGVGDVTLALRQHLAGERGKTFSLGIQPFVTLPTGRSPIGAGTWSAGAIIPVQYDVTEKLAVAFTGEGDAAADQSGDGRHLAYSGIWTLRYKVTDAINAYGEAMVQRDDDPQGHETHALLAGSLAWRPTKRFQIDGLVALGLTHTTPDIRLVTGGAILL